MLKTRADCLLAEADNDQPAAELLWKLDELITAIVLRNDYLLVAADEAEAAEEDADAVVVEPRR